jgi:hypothetical protein
MLSVSGNTLRGSFSQTLLCSAMCPAVGGPNRSPRRRPASTRFKNRPRFGPHNGALVLTGGRPLRVSQTTLSCAAAFSSASFVTTQAFERTTRMKMDSAF